jgi:hydroxylamine dehydrogenase
VIDILDSKSGTRARRGSAWWHGIYDVAKNFYMEFMPEVKRVSGPKLYDQIVKKYLASDVRHEWYIKGMSKEELQKIQKFYEKRYGGKNNP